MKILVTGGCGFIGTNFIRYVLNNYPDVFVLNIDKLTYASSNESNPEFEATGRYRHEDFDICNKDLVDVFMNDIDMVFNFAAESHVDNSIKGPKPFIDSNIVGTFTLLEAARKSKRLKRFIQISTDEVYGSRKNPATEGTILEPSSPYSASKASADMLCLAYRKTFNLPITITRSANNFGPHQHKEKLIPLFVTNLLKGEKVPVYGDGKNIRDWIYVDDNCRAIWLIATKGEHPIYNISGRTHFTNMEITEKLLSLTGRNETFIKYVPDRLGHDFQYNIDDTRLYVLENAFGIDKERTDFDTALKQTVKWYKERYK